jgi:hypothetical protein
MPPKKTNKKAAIANKQPLRLAPVTQVTLGPEADELAPASPAVSTPQIDPATSIYPSIDDYTFDTLSPDTNDPFEEEPEETDTDIRITWSAEMVEQLVEVLHTIWRDGGASDNSFKMIVFEKAAENVRRVYRGPLEMTSKKCKNKWADLKKKWGHWVFLGLQSGFGFHPDTELYDAYDYVWDNLNKSKPTIIWHKTHIMPHRDLIGEILQDVQATGRSSFTTAKPTRIDPRLESLNAANPQASTSPTPSLASQSLYNRSKKRVRKEGEDDQDERAPVAKKVDIGTAIAGLTTELTLARRAKETYLTNQQKAIQLLETEYKGRLHILAFIQACSFFQDAGNAGTFITLTTGETRDRFLEISIDTTLQN